ncbi:MAG: hypothetical protein JKY57_00055 [Kordiimonadaceae bacterium]|nr:hypothetical protein [Kordiimonadaceae bacterium]
MSRTLLSLVMGCLIVSACAKKEPNPIEAIPTKVIDRALVRLVAQWDYNKDGAATCEDISVLRHRQFGKLDKDGNRGLSEKEYRSVNFEDKSFVFHEFSALDIDASNMITLSEFVGVSHSEFRGLDQNDDCILDRNDAAYSVLAARARGLGRKGPAKKQENSRRQKAEELEPFEG